MKIIRRPQVFFFLLLALATLTIAQEVEDEPEFNYTEGSDKGPENWGDIKLELVQSLIDLPSRIVERVSESENILRSYQSGQNSLANRQFGPYGSSLPVNYRFNLGGGERFEEVIIRHGFVVDGIGFVVARQNGGTSTKFFGGQSGRLSKIRLGNNENITRISGTYGNYRHYNNQVVIGMLMIHTNFNEIGYGPYGQERNLNNIRAFTSPEKKNHPVVGFFGRHNSLLDSIGVFRKA